MADFVFLPLGCVPGQTCTGVQALILETNVLDGSILYTCNVAIAPNATPETYALPCSGAVYANDTAQFDAFCTDGEVVVVPTPAR